ncbi:MAG: hypothetical protein KAS87_03080 [Candidatus Omnitrophica bacterium]|nr:hypothetical protein [Candidatus Omnitrophota bacterium]
MQMNKSELSKIKGGRRLSIIFFFLYLLPFSFSLLPSASADQIRIRTIITPVGSQSEKWGAKGLMVCIGGETIPNGGCGQIVTGGFEIQSGGALGAVIEDTNLIATNDIVIFEDTSDGSAAGSNHQYDYTSGSESGSDTVYEVSGGSGEYTQRGLYGHCYTIVDDRGPNSCVNTSPCQCNIDLSHRCDTGFALVRTGYSRSRSATVWWSTCIKD